MAESALAPRSLADRLASIRQPVERPTFAREDRLELLARWFGAADSDLNGLFPSLANFTTRDVGFMV